MDDDDDDTAGLRTWRMFGFCGMCLFFLRHTAVGEKDHRTILIRREYDVARILGKCGAFICSWWSRSKRGKMSFGTKGSFSRRWQRLPYGQLRKIKWDCLKTSKILGTN